MLKINAKQGGVNHTIASLLSNEEFLAASAGEGLCQFGLLISSSIDILLGFQMNNCNISS